MRHGRRHAFAMPVALRHGGSLQRHHRPGGGLAAELNLLLA
jgi:hypothetical protein